MIVATTSRTPSSIEAHEESYRPSDKAGQTLGSFIPSNECIPAVVIGAWVVFAIYTASLGLHLIAFSQDRG